MSDNSYMITVIQQHITLHIRCLIADVCCDITVIRRLI